MRTSAGFRGNTVNGSKYRKHAVAAACSAALFMDFLDATVVNVAMPHFGAHFRVLPTHTHWIATIYVLALASCVLTSGWMQDRFGAKRVFASAVLAFTAASMACGLATSLPMLVFTRALQGMAAGMMAPVSFTLVLRAYDESVRAKVASYMLVPSFLAMIIGPAVGGLLLEIASWPWLFLINLPVGLVTWAIVTYLVPQEAPQGAGRFDWRGFATSSLGLVGIFGAVCLMGETGHLSGPSAAALVAGVLALILFVRQEQRTAHPMLDLSIFSNRVYAAGAATQFLLIACVTGSLFLFVLCQQQALLRTPLMAGAFCAIQAAAYVICVPLSDAICKHFEDTYVVLLGVLGILLSTWLLCSPGVQQDNSLLVPALVLRGLGMGLCLPISWTKSFKYLTPKQMSGASGAMSATIQLGTGTGTAAGALMLRFATQLAPHKALLPFQIALACMSLFALAGCVAAYMQRPEERVSSAHGAALSAGS